MEEIWQEQLRWQKEPFDALWAGRTRVSRRSYLAPLRSHALRVLRVISSLSNGRGSSPVWDGVYHNLHQAVSLQSVGLYTDVHGDSQWCRPGYEYDKAISEVKERFVAGQLVFQGAWNAFELAGGALFLTGKSPTTQAVRHKLADGGHQPIYGLREALFEAYQTSKKYIDIKHPAFREALVSGSDLSIAAELLRQFRNGVLHGKIESLEPLDWGPGSEDRSCQKQTELFQAQTRLILFLLQAIIARVEANHEVWFNEGDLVEELVFALQKEVPQDAIDHTEEGSDAPGLFADQKFIHQV